MMKNTNKIMLATAVLTEVGMAQNWCTSPHRLCSLDSDKLSKAVRTRWLVNVQYGNTFDPRAGVPDGVQCQLAGYPGQDVSGSIAWFPTAVAQNYDGGNLITECAWRDQGECASTSLCEWRQDEEMSRNHVLNHNFETTGSARFAGRPFHRCVPRHLDCPATHLSVFFHRIEDNWTYFTCVHSNGQGLNINQCGQKNGCLCPGINGDAMQEAAVETANRVGVTVQGLFEK